VRGQVRNCARTPARRNRASPDSDRSGVVYLGVSQLEIEETEDHLARPHSMAECVAQHQELLHCARSAHPRFTARVAFQLHSLLKESSTNPHRIREFPIAATEASLLLERSLSSSAALYFARRYHGIVQRNQSQHGTATASRMCVSAYSLDVSRNIFLYNILRSRYR